MSSPRSRTPRGSREDGRGPRTPRSREDAIASHRESIRRAIRQQYGVDEEPRRLAFDDEAAPRLALEELAAAPLRQEDDALRTSGPEIAAPPLRQNDALTTSATSVRSGPVWRFEPAPGGKAAWRRRRGLLVVERGRARLNIEDGQTVIESYTAHAVAPADELEVSGEVFYGFAPPSDALRTLYANSRDDRDRWVHAVREARARAKRLAETPPAFTAGLRDAATRRAHRAAAPAPREPSPASTPSPAAPPRKSPAPPPKSPPVEDRATAELRAALVDAVAGPLRDLRENVAALAEAPQATRKLDALLERVDGLATQRKESSPHAERVEKLREGLERRIEDLRGDVAALTRQSSQPAPQNDGVDAAALARAIANVEWGLDGQLRGCLERVVLRAGFLVTANEERFYTLHAAAFNAEDVYLGPSLRSFDEGESGQRQRCGELHLAGATVVDRDERVFEVVIDGSSTAFRADSDDDKHRWLSAVRAALTRHDAVSRELDASLLGHRPAARERAVGRPCGSQPVGHWSSRWRNEERCDNSARRETLISAQVAAARANDESGQTAPPPPPPKSADHVLVLCDVERASGKPQRRHSSPVRGPPLPAEIAVVERAAAEKLSDVTVAAAQTALDAARAAAARIETAARTPHVASSDTSPSLRASPETDTSGEVDALWPGADPAPPIDGDARRAQFARGLVTYDDQSDVDHDLIRHATQRVMAMLSQESSPAPSPPPPPGPKLDGSGPRVTIGADPYALARGLERSNSGEISPGRPVSDEPRTWRSRSSITNETPLFTPQSTRTWSDDDCLSPRSMPEPPPRDSPSPPRVPVRVRELSFRRPSLNRLASLEEDDEEAEQSPPPNVSPVRFDSTDVADIDDDEASPPEGTGINALDSTVADLDDEGAINALGDTPDLARGVSPPPSSAAESDAAVDEEGCTSAEEGDPTEPTDAAVDDSSTLQRVNDSLDDGSTLQRGDDEASGSSSSEEGDEPTDGAVDDGSTVRHRLTNDAGSGTDDDSTASTAFDTAVEALSPDGLSPQDSKVAARSPSLSPVPGSPPAGLTLRELATTPTREWPAPGPAPQVSSFIAAANAATPAPLSSDGSAAAADPEALTPASPASSGGDARVISSADGMAPFGEPDPSPPAGVYSATLSSLPPPPPRSWLSPVRSPVAPRPRAAPASRPRGNPPRRYLTPPRTSAAPPPRRHLTPPRTTRAASPPRTRYDFQSPQPSDARFAAQFRAAATASANGKKGELRRMRDEYAALKRDLADKKSRR